jgi:hypothetical protein
MTMDKGLVELAHFDGEPLARLAESRLREAGIDSVVRPMGAGPGGWGQAAAMPYGMWVRPADEAAARDVLELPAPAGDGATRRALAGTSRVALIAVVIAVFALVISVADRILERLLR